jgi:hypothetical protein
MGASLLFPGRGCGLRLVGLHRLFGLGEGVRRITACAGTGNDGQGNQEEQTESGVRSQELSRPFRTRT